MALEEYRVEPITFASARPILRTWHYDDYVNVQCKYAFGLFAPGKFGIQQLVGVCVYTLPAGPTAGKSYCPEAPEKVLELRRLACIDDTPKNAESFFVSKTLKWLKKNTDYKVIISYADPEQGHTGVIYKASNFTLVGMTHPGTALEYGGKKYHVRTATMLDRPYGRKIHELLQQKSDLVKKIALKSKYIYLYKLC